MAFNKNKALDNALKFLNQGKIPQAIGEYQHILRVDPKDQATLMTVGDLYARQGQMPQAIEYFERLAQVYLNDGFNSKAIAIYKKIAKLAPSELAPLERLADLYVQQGVLSEARPLFLQIAEAHLKANRAQKAVEVLNRLLEVEPENPRVQMRLAELYNVMGKKKEAGQTYLAYAQRLFDREDSEESQKLIERALEADPTNAAAYLLKAKILVATSHSDQAIAILEQHHPEADEGGAVTDLILSLELKSGQTQKASERARRQLARGHAHFAQLLLVASTMVESGEAAEALPLLRELRDPMIEASEQDKFLKTLSSAVERLPGQTEAIEMLAEFCRHTSDPFRLNSALSQLADAYIALGNVPRAEEILQELVDRNKGDERVIARLHNLRTGGETAKPATLSAEMAAPTIEEESAPIPAALPPIAEETLDEETQQYISQALTDVDLFSSYGLTQKATHLLESVLDRAPQHTPTLERLLDMHLGAGNERRTAELAAQLEQIHRGRGDTVNADRFAELRRRFQTAAGITNEELLPAVAPTVGAKSPASIEPSSVGAVPVDESSTASAAGGLAEFEIPLVAVDSESEENQPVQALEFPEAKPVSPELEAANAVNEVDLSDEWEAMVQDLGEAGSPPPPVQAKAIPAEDSAPVFEIVEETVAETAAAEAIVSEDGEIELLLTPEAATSGTNEAMVTTQDLINQLVAEVDELEAPAISPAMSSTSPAETHLPTLTAGSNGGPAVHGASIPETTAENLNELAGIFQEFRADLGESDEVEKEDLETHYNLGIAYREMGLLDEAIGEFQKVAKAVQQGRPFAYAMNCSTLLALTFMDKGEPQIASLWYRRALEVPGLDPETILALRYDLAVSLETAGEAAAALDSFRQVYAMNIDYRDVADHIATLQKA